MTYITYNTKHWLIGNPSGIINNSTNINYNSKLWDAVKILPKPEFLPIYLVRISDMKAVRGSELKEEYCALSYPWNQTGITASQNG